MRKFLLIIFCLVTVVPSFASHIAGGELFYEYVGPGANNSKVYKITMRLFRDCNSTGQVLNNESVTVGIYDAGTNAQYDAVLLPLDPPITSISLNTGVIPCLVNAPQVCFQVAYFSTQVTLPNNANGYTLTWTRCCRADAITNLSTPTGAGSTFTTNIPGTNLLPTGNNNSPQFLIKDTALVCKDQNFVLDFGATDTDGDSLVYSFCDAFAGGTSNNPNPAPQPFLDLTPLSYRAPYTGFSPLGSAVTINPRTGKITGRAPGAGRYVISVCISEVRNNIIINTHRKDFILEVGSCDFAAAEPKPFAGTPYSPEFTVDFISCKSFTVNFVNNNNSSTINEYKWDFGVTTRTTDTSSRPTPSYTYPDTGVYKVKLVVTGANSCVDSNEVTLAIYPGFTGNFDVTGSCFINPFKFTDRTTSAYGTINSWTWDFGNAATNNDTSTLRNPSYTYPSPATRNARLYVTDTKGCIDTIIKPVIVSSGPLLTLPFRDTIMCSIDSLQLIAQGSGVFTWTPNYNIINPNSSSPIVYPKDTTTYVVSMFEDGCTATDSILVRVVDSVALNAGNDTIICSRDIIRMNPISNGLNYTWSPTEHLIGESNIKNPFASPIFTDNIRRDTIVTYTVTSRIGTCLKSDQVRVKAVRYPFVDAGRDTSICFASNVQLNASIVGSTFKWFPTNTLTGANTLSPVAGPKSTTRYFLTVSDTIGCPKIVYDSVTVTVIPPIIPFAGNDTNIIVGQPLQLNATGGLNYAWTPSTGLDSPSSSHPIATLGANIDSIIYSVRVSTAEGCFADDKIKVVVFKTQPDIYVPSAFTPNQDGRNDLLRPIAVGLRRINYFRVYNRWGQLLYSTSSVGDGWDGTYKGKPQATGTYIYAAQAEDYLGRVLTRKGTAVLIR